MQTAGQAEESNWGLSCSYRTSCAVPQLKKVRIGSDVWFVNGYLQKMQKTDVDVDVAVCVGLI